MRVVIVASVITLLPLILTVSLPRPMRDFPGLPRLQSRPRDNPGDPGIAGCNQRGVRPVRPAGCGGPHQMNPKSRRSAVASPSSAHTDRSDRDPGRRDPAGVVSSDTERADQQIFCTGRGNARPPAAELLAEHHHSENGARQKLDVFTPTAYTDGPERCRRART